MPITPDTKDWTFVLDTTCDECGFDTRSLDVADIPRLVRENAAAWPPLLARPDAGSRPDDATWSTLEYACHVRDVFRLFRTRLELVLAEDDPLFANWDQDATAVEDDYGSQDPAVVARELTAAADAVADAFAQVRGEQWDRPARRSDGAVFTVASFGRYFAHDPVHHLWDVTR